MKNAYLIMAHDNQRQLKILLKSLDYYDNDIFLHIDKKSIDSFTDDLACIVKNASLHIYSKYRVYWADMSQTRCELYLLREATRTIHDYYHLLSGHDLVIKDHEYILNFLDSNRGKEFVHFQSSSYVNKRSCSYYHFLFPVIQRTKNPYIKSILRKIEEKSLSLQIKLGINRQLYCGANWFSITHDFALDLLSNSKRVLRRIKYTVSSDECLLQVFIKFYSSKEFNLFCTTDDDYSSISREIDWKRGNPYVWKLNDYNYLVNSKMCYARKFDENIDPRIIYKIAEKIGVSLEECGL